MKLIVLAAGPGSRLGDLTKDTPKCLVEMEGSCLLTNTLGHFKNLGVDDIAIVVGYEKEKFTLPNTTYYHNDTYRSNDILHSLMCARDFMEGEDVMVCYSDIWFEEEPIKKMLEAEGDLVVAVDSAWEQYYEERIEHPYSEAEMIAFDSNKHVVKVGKGLAKDDIGNLASGEFMGLMKFSESFLASFKNTFDELNEELDYEDAFQNAKRWQSAYITDMFQELADRGQKIDCELFEGGWSEIDTLQDFTNLVDKIN